MAMAGQAVTYTSKHPDGDASGYLFGSPTDGAAAATGVVLLHEWWGVDDWTRSAATDIHDAGFVVLAADIFRGVLFKDPKEARKNMLSLDWSRAALDVEAAAVYLRSRGCARVGVAGFAFGGSLALVSAANHSAVIDAVAPICGVSKPEVADVTQIKCPVQGHYASKDKVVGVSSPADYNGLAEKLWGASVPLEMCIYDAEHAFFNPHYPMYNASASGEMYANLFRFLRDSNVKQTA